MHCRTNAAHKPTLERSIMFETPNGFMQKMVEVGGGNSSTLQRKGPYSSIHVQRTDRAKIQYRRCELVFDHEGEAAYCIPSGIPPHDIFVGLNCPVFVKGDMTPLSI